MGDGCGSEASHDPQGTGGMKSFLLVVVVVYIMIWIRVSSKGSSVEGLALS